MIDTKTKDEDVEIAEKEVVANVENADEANQDAAEAHVAAATEHQEEESNSK